MNSKDSKDIQTMPKESKRFQRNLKDSKGIHKTPKFLIFHKIPNNS